jgi:hypothetical protein
MSLRSGIRPTKRVAEKRARTRSVNLIVRLSEHERDMLDVVATREKLNVSETVRWLVRREYEAGLAAKRRA